MTKPIVFKQLDVTVTPRSILKRMDGRLNQRKWLGAISRLCEEYRSQIRPRGLYRKVLCRPNGELLQIGSDYRFNSSFLTDLVPRVRPVAVFLVTIGPDLERSIREAARNGRHRKAFILDCLGSGAAEKAAAAIQSEVERTFHLSMRRYSPGYNDWDISEQETLFDFLGRENAGRLGVGLTPDFMMTPRKSVSGIILPRPVARPETESASVRAATTM